MTERNYLWKGFPHILHGGDYNPDQWTGMPQIQEEDMRLMKLANCNEMTLGIFAWAKLEPEEGKFDFSFMDRAMDLIAENGGRVILATPSGARPAWLSQKYPEVLRTNADRTVNLHGRRHNHCFTSPVYRKKTAEINARLAQRYKGHPALLMWHISNEYGGECHCAMCREAFRDWLKRKYKTLDALNEQWWTYFWAHTYTDWSQIEPPSPLGESSTHGLTLDWKRFVTDQTIDFMKNEISVLKEITPDVPVTTNLMGFYQGLDYRKLAKELDAVSWDNYPVWRGNEISDIELASDTALIHDLNRSLLGKPFMMMESTPSHVNWHTYNKLKRPGQHMLSSLQAVAHGSDSVQYFQWRKSRGSSEKFHGAVVDHVGHENTRVFREVAELGKRLGKLDCIVGTTTVSKVALLYDWSNNWAIDDAQGFQRNDKKVMRTIRKHYRPLWRRGINTDVIGFDDDFSKYSLIIAPMIYTVSEELENKISDYVSRGGIILCTYMTGMVNENDLCHLGGFPAGRLKDVFGLWNEEIDTLYPDESNKVYAAGREYKAVDYCEIVHPTSAETIAEYGSDFYSGESAATVNNYGKGRAYYVAFRDEGDFTDTLTEALLKEAGVASEFDGALPNGVTAHSRTDGETIYVFLENYSMQSQSAYTGFTWSTADSGEVINGEISLKPYETLILSRKLTK